MRILFIILVVLAGAAVMLKFGSSQTHDYRYVITETKPPTSLDPLDGDQTQNLPVQRMINATPVEVDSKGTLKSLVLSDFNYIAESQTMQWTVKDGVKFSDGSVITANDVAFAVARMAFTRPNFPVIENIEGVETWVKTPKALESFPTGIKVSGNKIEIKFTKPVDHPLFRFCLEIFSIIPKKCVDLATNKVNCEKIPVSGHYEIVDRKDAEIKFQLRSDSIHGETAPKQIAFEYKLPKDIFGPESKLSGNTVIQGNEVTLSIPQLKKMSDNFKISYLPSSRIALHILNPKFGAFKNKNCRLIYAMAYRKAFKEIATAGFKLESSVFTDVLPGYLCSNDLAQAEYDKLSAQEKESCLKTLRENPPRWAQQKNDEDLIYFRTAEKTYEILEIKKPEPLIVANRKEESEAFLSGAVSAMGASTGFWALDPAGDIQMLLTPNMHKPLQFVTEDQKVQSLIKKLKKGSDNDPQAFKVVNQYIHDEALFNVFAHVRRFYASDSLDNIAELPLSITSPAPWQVFRMQ